ncbi:MAG TPA: nuclear transport factor 2 family protein [Solirubrobacterales bacterium]|nr:nuclear transport factor 2 family protein [Solirubrobacterales bacterium]
MPDVIYRAIVKRKARGIFESLSRGDWPAATADMADDVHHVFAGDNALGGERHSREAFERWFQRLYRLIPEIEFEVHDVAVRGWPWDTAVAVEWTDRGKGADGTPYVNHGSHWIKLRWGKGVEVHGYLDTERVDRLLDAMAAAGIEEATAAPIGG